MEPDFIFNTLNSVIGLVRKSQSDAAVSLVVTLSGFLRRAFRESDLSVVKLGEEVAQLVRYLAIQKVRFAERLQWSSDISAELLELPVPFLLLQPLVENAIIHGIAKQVDGGTIRVVGSRSGGLLRMSIYNDGPNLGQNWDSRAGIGLSNLRMRLQMLYGTQSTLSLRNWGERGVEALVSLPVYNPK